MSSAGSRLAARLGFTPAGALLAASILIGAGVLLAVIALASMRMLDSAARGDAVRTAIRNAETFTSISLESGDFRNGQIKRAALSELGRSAANAVGISGVRVWERSGAVRVALGSLAERAPEAEPPPQRIYSTTVATGHLDPGETGGARVFIPVTYGAAAPFREVVEVSIPDPALEEVLSSRRGLVVVLITGLAAVLYIALTPLAMRASRALAERRAGRYPRLRREIKRALDEDEIDLDFQPKVNLHTGAVEGVEALARWQHPKEGYVPPMEYLPQLERTDLILPFTLRILTLALEEQAAWQRRGVPLEMAVNLSTAALQSEAIVDRIRATVANHELPASMLTLEITETAIADEDLAAKLTPLRQAGIRLSIDDFGTGQSSLARLGSLPFDELKIDREFIRGLDSNGGVVLVRTMIELGHRLGMTVVAEGVEWATTATWLARSGCDGIQGYLVAEPMPADTLGGWLARGEGERVARLLGEHRRSLEEALRELDAERQGEPGLQTASSG